MVPKVMPCILLRPEIFLLLLIQATEDKIGHLDRES